MKHANQNCFRRTSRVSLAASAALLLAAPALASAAPSQEKLTDGATSLVVSPGSDQLVTSWLVDGVSQMVLQSFYYRVGSIGGESALGMLPIINQTRLNASTLSVLYGNANFTVETTYSLSGGTPGSGNANLSEQVKISNLTGGSLNFHLFQYSDFDLSGTSAGDTVVIGQNLMGQYNEALQYKGVNVGISDTVVTPGATRAQAGFFPDIINSLNDGSPTTLNNNTGPATGDAVWAFQWELLIAAGTSVTIGIDKGLIAAPIPEPTVLALGLVGAALAVARRRR